MTKTECENTMKQLQETGIHLMKQLRNASSQDEVTNINIAFGYAEESYKKLEKLLLTLED